MGEVFKQDSIRTIEKELLENTFIYQMAIKDVTDRLDKIGKRLHSANKHRYILLTSIATFIRYTVE